MAHTEIEPWAAKTLLFLRSSAENSLEDMRTMLMEIIHQKYSGRKPYKMIPPLTGVHNDSYEKPKIKEAKSSSSDHKPKPHSAETFSSPTITIASPESYGSESDSSSENSEMVILEDDESCAICKQVTSASWNQFVECSECHLLYHQQCHTPPIPDSDVSDPRTVWYCRNCTKTVSKPKTSSVSSSSTSSQSSKSSSSKLPSRTNTSSPSFGSKPFGGVSMSSKKSSSSKSSHSSSNKVTPNINMASADKRLQNMKKKAALKQEKRQK